MLEFVGKMCKCEIGYDWIWNSRWKSEVENWEWWEFRFSIFDFRFSIFSIDVRKSTKIDEHQQRSCENHWKFNPTTLIFNDFQWFSSMFVDFQKSTKIENRKSKIKILTIFNFRSPPLISNSIIPNLIFYTFYIISHQLPSISN